MLEQLNQTIKQIQLNQPELKDYSIVAPAEYVFPLFVKDQWFESFDQIRQAIFEQAYDSDCEGIDRLFQHKNTANSNPSDPLQFRCRKCQARLVFTPVENGAYRLDQINNVHAHDSLGLSDEERRYMSLFKGRPQLQDPLILQRSAEREQECEISAQDSTPFCETPSAEDPISQTPPKPLPIKRIPYNPQYSQTKPQYFPKVLPTPPQPQPQPSPQPQPTYLPRLFPDPQPQPQPLPKRDILKSLQCFAQSGYTTYIRRGRHQNMPSLIIAVSDTMKQKYKHYGDILTLNLSPYTWQIPGDLTYTVTVASLFTASRNMQVAGYLIHAECDEAAMYWGLKYLFAIHKRKPPVIVTDYGKGVCRALEILEEFGGYKGVLHLMDPEVFYQGAEQVLRQEGEQMDPGIKNILRNVIEECSYEAARAELQKINQKGTEPYRKLREYVLSAKEKIWRSGLPNCFVGMPLSNKKEVNDRFSKLLPPKNAQEFLKGLESVQESINKIVKSDIKQYIEPIEQIFEDNRIELVRDQVESDIFEIFMSNYLKQFTQQGQLNLYDLNNQSPQQANFNQNIPTFLVDLKQNRCSCGFPTKIGLPCSHMLALARQNDYPSYKDFILTRWKIMIISVKHGMSTSITAPQLVKLGQKY